MTLNTARPNSTVVAGGTVTGAASRHAATNDDSDASYVTIGGFLDFQVGVPALSLPAGAVIKDVGVRGRVRAVTGSSTVRIRLLTAGGVATSVLVASSVTTTLTNIASGTSPATADMLASMILEAEVIGPAPVHPDARFVELYFDRVYVTKPVVAITPVTDPWTAGSIVPVWWTYSSIDTDGGPQTRRRVRVFTAAQYTAPGFDPATSPAFAGHSGDSGPEMSMNVGPLPNGTYRAYMRGGQTVNGSTLWSDWVYDEFTVNVSAIDIGSVVAVPDDATGSIDVTVTPDIAPGTDWSVNPAAAAKQWVAIAWSPELGLLAAVDGDTADTAAIMTSPDGVTWTARTTPSAVYAEICWAAELGLFVAVGVSAAATSPDGITWTSRTVPAATWSGVCWSPELGLLCAASQSGGDPIITSPDGITWTTRTTPGSETLTDITWTSALGGLFVAVGVSTALTSPDGITWTTRTIGAGNWSSVAWSPTLGLFAAVASSGAATGVATSPDGITWTSQTIAAGTWWSIVWAEELGLFVAVGDDITATSPDGITWTTAAPPEANNWRDVTWAPELNAFVAVATDGTNRTMMTRSWYYVDVERSVVGTDEWEPVRYATLVRPTGETFTVTDREAHQGIYHIYRARAVDFAAGGIALVGDWMESNAVQWNAILGPWCASGAMRLHTLDDATLDTTVTFAEDGVPSPETTPDQGVFTILDREDQVAVTGVRHSPISTMVLLTRTLEDTRNMRAMLRKPYLIALPPDEWGWDEMRYIAPNRVRERRAPMLGAQPVTHFEIAFTVIGRPADGTAGSLD